MQKRSIVLYKNPSLYPINGLTVLARNNVFAYTANSILHFDGVNWRVLYTASGANLLALDSDGEFVLFSLDSLGLNAHFLPALFVSRVISRDGVVELSEPIPVKVGVTHDVAGIKFLKRGVALATAILECAILHLSLQDSGKVSIRSESSPFVAIPTFQSLRHGTSAVRGYSIIYAHYGAASVRLRDDKLYVSRLFDLRQALEVKNEGPISPVYLVDVSMSDSNFIFALTRDHLIVSECGISGSGHAQAIDSLCISGYGTIPANSVQAVLATRGREAFVITKNGFLLRGRFPSTGKRNISWDVIAADLPLFYPSSIAMLDSNEILVGGEGIVKCSIPANESASVSRSVRELGSGSFWTLAQIFESGSAYGIAIAHLDKTAANWVFAVDLLGKNKLYRISELDLPLPPLNSVVNVADKRGLSGRGEKNTPENEYINCDVGAVAGDVDEDGDEDIIVSYLDGSSELYLNNGDGYFRDATNEAGLNVWVGRSECVALADVNNDGYLDLFTTSFVGANRLFMNKGGGRFKDVTQMSGFDSKNLNVCAAFGDINGDGYPDLYVGRWDMENSMYLNNGDGTFKEITQESGTGCGPFHKTNSVLFADFNNDGKLDLFVGNRGGDNRLFINTGEGHFKDVTMEANLTDTVRAYGSVFGDFDNDGLLDLFVAGLGKIALYKNCGIGSHGVPLFRDISGEVFPPSIYYLGYNTGAATLVEEGMGNLDIIVGQAEGRTYLLKNMMNTQYYKMPHFIDVKVTGVKSNRDGVGAKLILYKDGRMVAYREVESSYGYASSSSKTQHFGIPDARGIYKLEVLFPASGVKRVLQVTPGSFIEVGELEGAEALRSYFLKGVTKFFMDQDWISLVSMLGLVLVEAVLLVAVKNSRRRRVGNQYAAREGFVILKSALIAYLLVLIGLFAREQFFVSPEEWMYGGRNALLDWILPLGAPLVAAALIVRKIDNDRRKLMLRFEAYHELHVALRRFAHGEGGASNLTRLSLFVRNLKHLLPPGIVRDNVTASPARSLTGYLYLLQHFFKVSAGQREGWCPGATEALRSKLQSEQWQRFESAVREFKIKVYEEIQSIITLLSLVGDESNELKWVGMESGRLTIAVERLRTILEKLTILYRTGDTHPREIMHLQRDALESSKAVQDAIYAITLKFEEQFITDVTQAIDSELSKFRTPDGDIQIKFNDVSPNARAVIGASEFRDVLSILVKNALDALSEKQLEQGEKYVLLTSYADEGKVVVTVEDNGPGIPEEYGDLIFHSGFTTKRGNHGFGLNYAKRVMDKYGGRIYLDDTYSKGARFFLELKRAVC
ncbi:MAG: FG-GAP-like repeat-containing protein [Bacteroidota bacterium]